MTKNSINYLCELSSRKVRTSTAIIALTLCAVAGYTFPGYASEVKEVTRSVTVYSLPDNPKLADTLAVICGDASIKLSIKARAACESHNFPPLTKALSFRNSGIGAEFNTLARQRDAATAQK